jgi:hypothetical protein
MLATTFGLHLTNEQRAAIDTVTLAILAVIVRQSVTSVSKTSP